MFGHVGGDDGIDHSTARREFSVSNGDLLVMRGDTQKHWHHCVPKARSRRPRININFRYIIPGSPDAERGQQTYYKYMVSPLVATPHVYPSALSHVPVRVVCRCTGTQQCRRLIIGMA